LSDFSSVYILFEDRVFQVIRMLGQITLATPRNCLLSNSHHCPVTQRPEVQSTQQQLEDEMKCKSGESGNWYREYLEK